nr:MAG: hypothetical protein [Bacteriophage sp.]
MAPVQEAKECEDMQNLESCIIKMGEVSALIRMIDDTFVDGRVGFSDDEDGKQLELSLNLLREAFGRNLAGLRAAYYGGAV